MCPTNNYFNNFGAINEQRLVEDVIVESIKIMGTDCFYLPNNNDVARDLLYGEDPLKKFTSAFPVEIYPENVMDYGGDKELFSKFGLEIKNQMTVIMSKRSFNQRVPSSISRPREGDLIYVPFLNGTGELYEIKFTNQNKDFFTLGRKVPYFYELELEKFRYSQEIIDTGLPDIDIVPTNSAYQIDLDINKNTGTGNYVVSEIVYQSNDNTLPNAYTTGIVQSWDSNTSTLSVSNIMGEFANNAMITGNTSNANYMISSFDSMDVMIKNEPYDNKIIEDESENYIDNTETNSFGSL
jgi:Virus neck protein